MAINNNDRSVSIPCIECGRMLKFRIKNDIVVEGEGKIACNVPAAVCQDCVGIVVEVGWQTLPASLCFDGLSAIVAREILESFTFLLPRSEAVQVLCGAVSRDWVRRS